MAALSHGLHQYKAALVKLVYQRTMIVTRLPATDPLPHTVRHIDQPHLRGADFESILAIFPKLTENG